MASSKGFIDYVLEQLSKLEDITYRPMMGEFLLYKGGTLFGGVYDDRLLLKITKSCTTYALEEAIPYPKAKPMFLVENIDDAEYICQLVETTCEDLKKDSK